MKFVSIQKKLRLMSTRIILGTMVIYIILGITLGVLNSNNLYRRVKSDIESNLYSKGTLFIKKDSKALATLVEGYEIISIRDVISATIHEDKDAIYGIFMDKKCAKWVIIDPENKSEILEENGILIDSISVWANAVRIPSHKKFKTKNGVIIEFAAPVIENNEFLGTIRYGITTHTIDTIITEERRGMLISSVSITAIFIVFGLLLFLIESHTARRQAESITHPLNGLTNAVNSIANKDYTIPIAISSNDEVGDLAKNFEEMRRRIRHNMENLEQIVNERTAQLKAAQKEMTEKALRAGMADIASGTLHNVGNLLNSVKASIDLINKSINDSPISTSLSEANNYLELNNDAIYDSLRHIPKGEILIQLYAQLEKALLNEHTRIKEHTQRLIDKVKTIENAIAAQQKFARGGQFKEELSVQEVIEEVIHMHTVLLGRHHIQVETDFQNIPKVVMEQARFVNILVNLIKNAIESISESNRESGKITISIKGDDHSFSIVISDTGVGILKENLKKVFAPGFSTKKNGHGFGLQISACHVNEMGGRIWAESGGEGMGATFFVQFPLGKML